MAEKILGKIIEIKVNGASVPFQSHGFDENFNVIDTTDSDTAGDSTESEVGRATRELKVEGLLKNSGAVVKGTGMAFNYDSVAYKITDAKFSETYGEVDVTDSGTTGDGSETETGFAERKLSVDMWVRDTEASPARGVSKTATLTFGGGTLVSGSARLESFSVQGEVKGAVKQTVGGTWQGTVAETPSPLGGITPATEYSIEIIYKAGAATNKSISGIGKLMSREISQNVDDVAKISWGFKINGAITESIYSNS